MHTLTLITIEFAAAAHLMMSLVLFFFARRRVSFLSQAWIMLLICLMYCAALFYVYTQEIPALGILHPVLLIYLLACSFLQSIYPLGLCMPGYLQWGRMWTYASPALILISLYAGGALAGSDMIKVYDASDFREYLLSGDVILRIAALGLSIYYIVNIFRLPHRLTRQVELPRWMITYGVALGAVSLFFVIITLSFNRLGVIIYILLFTLVNMFLFFRILEPVFNALPHPPLRRVVERPTEEEISHSEQNDFNEANVRRFEVLEFLMQHDRPWLDSQFTRDKLCRHTGLNRHLVLQALRSQGYNDTHEYIYRYRVEELKRLILSGEMQSLQECERAGFRSVKMAYSNFERMENVPLDIWFDEHKRPVPDTMEEQADTTQQHPIHKSGNPPFTLIPGAKKANRPRSHFFGY